MLRFILNRFLQAIPVLFIIATATFFMARLAPGGPFTQEKSIPPEILEKLNAYYGFDKPLYRAIPSQHGPLVAGRPWAFDPNTPVGGSAN